MHDPVTFVVDVFNLIDNSHVDELTAKKERTRQALRDEQVKKQKAAEGQKIGVPASKPQPKAPDVKSSGRAGGESGHNKQK